MSKKRAYTLVELMIVMAIIALMAVLAVPAFASYGRKQAVAQKSNEIVGLLKRGYVLSKNPDKDILSYQITVVTGAVNSVFLKSSGSTTVQEVTHITADNGETLLCPNTSGCPVINFPTNTDSGWSVTISGSAYTGANLFQLSGADQYNFSISTGSSLYNISAVKM